MDAFIQTVILGLGTGSLDALLALGVVLIYRTTGVLNFAIAGTGTLAAYVMYSVGQGRPLWLAVVAGILAGAAAGLASNMAISGIRTKHYALSMAVATLALAILIQQVVRIAWGTQAGQFPAPAFVQSSISLGTVVIPGLYIAGFITSGVLAAVVGLYLRFSRTGTMIRALADNQEAATLCGGNITLLVAGVWTVAGALSAVTAFFAAQIVFDPSFLDPFFLASLIAAVLGGLRSLPGAFLGALALEMARTLFSAYAPAAINPYTQTFLLILLIAALALTPRRWLATGGQRIV